MGNQSSGHVLKTEIKEKRGLFSKRHIDHTSIQVKRASEHVYKRCYFANPDANFALQHVTSPCDKEPATSLISSLCSDLLCLTSQIIFPANVHLSAVTQKAFVHIKYLRCFSKLTYNQFIKKNLKDKENERQIQMERRQEEEDGQ